MSIAQLDPTVWTKLPAISGVYALQLFLSEPVNMKIGGLGTACLSPGSSVYIGSARGPGGIRARLGRHLRGGGVLRWHVDYLRNVSVPVAVAYFPASPENQPDGPLECCWSRTLAALPGWQVPFPYFGSSDCRSGCPAHLVATIEPSSLPQLQAHILAAAVGAPQEAVCVLPPPE